MPSVQKTNSLQKFAAFGVKKSLASQEYADQITIGRTKHRNSHVHISLVPYWITKGPRQYVKLSRPPPALVTFPPKVQADRKQSGGDAWGARFCPRSKFWM